MQVQRYKYFSAGLLSPRDRYPEHLESLQAQLEGGGAGRPLGVAATGLPNVSTGQVYCLVGACGCSSWRSLTSGFREWYIPCVQELYTPYW